MGKATYTSAGKTIEITSDYESIEVSVSGFSSVNYDRAFYISYKRESQTSGSYSYLGEGYLEVAADVDPDDPWVTYQDGLWSETTYSVKIVVYNNSTYNIVWEWEEESAITTDAKVPIPTINSVDTSNGISDVKIYWDVDEHVSGTEYIIYVSTSKNGTYYEKTDIIKKVPTSGYTSISVDKYDTTYWVYVEASYDGETEISNKKSFSIALEVPSTWSWTEAEKGALNNHGQVSTITKSRWNNFIAWARTVIAYLNAKNGKSYEQIPNEADMGTDKILYAESWNAIDYYSRVACGNNGHVTRSSRRSCKRKLFYRFNRYFKQFFLNKKRR